MWVVIVKDINKVNHIYGSNYLKMVRGSLHTRTKSCCVRRVLSFMEARLWSRR